MYKKTKPRSVMELLNKNLSEREVASTLSCSRNTVAGIIARCKKYGKTWDDIKDLSDDQVYEILRIILATLNTSLVLKSR